MIKMIRNENFLKDKIKEVIDYLNENGWKIIFKTLFVYQIYNI